MANIFLQQKAENTLKRADDLIETGQKRVAFQELQSIIAGTRSTKNRQWSETVEEVMMKFIELCVDLRKGSEAKTAIMQFKSLCLPDHASSLDKALKYFVEQAEQRALTAQTQSNSESLTLQKDLEDEIPENILMSEVSGEDLKDRKDREIVTPWLKFLWETYRIVLDILKMFPNKELQIRYHDTSQRAFKFCKDYKRKQEFRRLAEMLRIHLANIQKYASQKDATHAKINLNNAETIQNYLDTRFKQLDVASDLELWNEAFKSIEDIHALIRLSKKAVDPLLMIKFYEHLTKIFWVSENYLLHAYAYYKLFNLRIALKKEDNNLEHLSSTLFLAALSIPSTSTEYDIMNIDFVEREKQQRMAFLLGLTVPPTKEQLLEEIIKKQVSKHVASELSSLYHILEVDFHPLDLCSKMSAVFKFLETKPELSNYIRPLQKITLSRLLPQLSKVYEVIKISEIVKLAPFVSLPEIEREIVLSVQQRHLQATIDHQSSSIIFGKGVAPFDSDNLRSELIKLSKKLAEARLLISPQQIQSERESQEKLVKSIVSKLPEEHAQLLERKQFIEKKKIYLANEKKKEEELREVKAREAAKKREEEEKKEQERQQQKLEEEAKKRREEEEKISQAQLLLAELEKNNAITDQTLKALAAKAGKKKKAAAADIAAVVDVDTLLEVKREEIEKEKKEREKKLTDEAKNFDYLERARRLEEIPLLKEHYLKQKKEDREAYEKLVQKSEEDFKKQLTETQQMRSQIEKMFEDKNEFVADFVMKKRKELYEKKLEDYNKKKDDAKQKWLARREKIKQEIDRIDEEKLQKQREREEKERKQQEEENKRRKEQEDREEKLRRISEMQLQKEREAEERIRKQKEEALKRLPPKDDKKAYRPPTSSRWENIDSDKDKQPAFTKRRFDDDEPPRRRFEDDQGPPRRRFEDDQPPRRRFEDDSSAWRSPAAKKDDQGPPRRRFEDDQPRRRFEDDQGPPRRRFEDDQGPPRRRFDDDQPPRRRFEDDQPKRRQEDDQTWQRSAKKPASSSSTSSAFSSTPAPKTQTTADDDGWQKASSKTSGGRWR